MELIGLNMAFVLNDCNIRVAEKSICGCESPCVCRPVLIEGWFLFYCDVVFVLLA